MVAFDERVRRLLETEEPVEYLGEPKLDGAGVELVYEKGRLAVGSTRGDGLKGEDVTANLRQSHSIPLVLDAERRRIPERVSVRGEIALPIAAFERLNARRLDARSGALREPAQRRGGLAAPAPRHRYGPPARPRVPRLRRRRGPAEGRRDPGRSARAAGRLGLPRERREPDLPRRGGRAGLPRAHAGGPRRAADRDRRDGDQGEPPRPAAGARRALPLAALGHRLQVPPAAGDHRGRGDRGAGGPHGGADSGGEAHTRPRGRRHGRERLAPQPGRDRSQGRPRGRHRDRPARR